MTTPAGAPGRRFRATASATDAPRSSCAPVPIPLRRPKAVTAWRITPTDAASASHSQRATATPVSNFSTLVLLPAPSRLSPQWATCVRFESRSCTEVTATRTTTLGPTVADS
jgi:hypothetical protein